MATKPGSPPEADIEELEDGIESISFIDAPPPSVVDVAEARETAGMLPIDGRYELRELIGRGAMGDVWAADDILRHETVALKILREGLSGKEYRERFFREARILTRITHPNVVKLFNYGTDPKPYIVMELLTGQDLSRLLMNWRTLPVSHAAEIFRQASSGLTQVHKAGVIHRDIKPGNIFLVAGGNVKVVDFGLSKKDHTLTQGAPARTPGDQFTTQTGTLLGTVKYMSPEQLLGQEIDFRTDLWSLAVVLFKMLTGQDAFEGKDEVDYMLAIVKGPPPVPSRAGRELSQELDNFFMRCFERRPDARFDSADEMAAAFTAVTQSAARRR